MLEGGRISGRQLTLLLVFTIIGTAYFYLPGLSANYAGRDFWLSPVPAALPGLLVVLVAVKLHSLHHGRTFIEYSREIAGRYAGSLAGLILIFWLVQVNSMIIHGFGEFMNIGFMPQTPTLVFTATITAVAALAVYYGVELLGRASELIFFIFLVFAGVFLVLSIGVFQPELLSPLLAGGLVPVLAGAMPPAGWYGELMVAAMLLPFLNKPGKARSSGIWAVVLITLLLTVNSLATALAYGEEVKRLIFPVLTLAREITLFGFFERMEVLILLSWIAALFVKAGVFYYCAVLAVAQWTGLSSYRPVIMPLGVITVAMGFLNFHNVIEFAHFITAVFFFYVMAVCLLMPALLLALALYKKRQTGG